MTSTTLVGADTRTPADVHAANLAAFADYVAGPIQMTLEQWPSFVGRQGIDLARSRVALQDEAIVAFALACPRTEAGRWRLAGMGALPAARGTGAAQGLLDDFLSRAKAEGMAFAELECFAENERALRLYRSRGFEAVCALNAWKVADPGAPVPEGSRNAPGVRLVAREDAFDWLSEAGRRFAWLPFQNTGRSLAAQTRPLTIWRCGSAQLVFSVVEGTPTTVHSLVDLDPALRDAETLARALAAAHGDAWAPPILRDDIGGAALGRAGFVQQGLNQVYMRCRL